MSDIYRTQIMTYKTLNVSVGISMHYIRFNLI